MLVIIQMAGGNDGLNTLIPHADDNYYRARPRIGIPAAQALRLNERVGLHPEMVELKRLFDDGKLGIVPNVGYPNPSRSHFRSMDIWETASPEPNVGFRLDRRYFDNDCGGCPAACSACVWGKTRCFIRRPTHAGRDLRESFHTGHAGFWRGLVPSNASMASRRPASMHSTSSSAPATNRVNCRGAFSKRHVTYAQRSIILPSHCASRCGSFPR